MTRSYSTSSDGTTLDGAGEHGSDCLCIGCLHPADCSCSDCVVKPWTDREVVERAAEYARDLTKVTAAIGERRMTPKLRLRLVDALAGLEVCAAALRGEVL